MRGGVVVTFTFGADSTGRTMALVTAMTLSDQAAMRTVIRDFGTCDVHQIASTLMDLAAFASACVTTIAELTGATPAETLQHVAATLARDGLIN